MLPNPAASATSASRMLVSSTSRFARWTRRVVATASGEAPACRANSRCRCRGVIPSASARSSTDFPSSRNPRSISRRARETVAAATNASAPERSWPRAAPDGSRLTALGAVSEPWHLYPVFLLMSTGWGAMSGAAINIILAPWWVRRRGLAVSLAFNGATLGGVIVAPALVPLIQAVGLQRALSAAAVALLGVTALAAAAMRRGPETLGLAPDGDPTAAPGAGPAAPGDHTGRGARSARGGSGACQSPSPSGWRPRSVCSRTWSLVAPALGTGGAARAISATTAAALIGRLATGLVVDCLDRRLVASATLAVQAAALWLLSGTPRPAGLYAGCALFGLGVGNLTTLPGLILAVEWPRERFSALVALAVGINQLTFAFGPSLVGLIRDWRGSYGPALMVCIALQAVAAVVVAFGPRRGVPGRHVT